MEAEETQEQHTVLPIWCIVANVVMERSYGPGGEETRSGTKHFRAGAKVFCVRFFWFTHVVVVGRHRSSNQFITTAVREDHLVNYRSELVYTPRIIQTIQKYVFDSGLSYPRFDGTEEAKKIADEIIAKWLNSKTQPYVSTRTTQAKQDQDEEQI